MPGIQPVVGAAQRGVELRERARPVAHLARGRGHRPRRRRAGLALDQRVRIGGEQPDVQRHDRVERRSAVARARRPAAAGRCRTRSRTRSRTRRRCCRGARPRPSPRAGRRAPALGRRARARRRARRAAPRRSRRRRRRRRRRRAAASDALGRRPQRFVRSPRRLGANQRREQEHDPQIGVGVGDARGRAAPRPRSAPPTPRRAARRRANTGPSASAERTMSA